MIDRHNRLTIGSYDRHNQAYLQQTDENPSPLAIKLAQMVGAAVPIRARVLEIGSGTGRDARYLMEHGLNVTCSDAAQSFVAHMIADGIPNVLTYDIVADEPPPGPWDVIFANAVLLHLSRAQLRPSLARLRLATQRAGRIPPLHSPNR